jgi:hypothetical protein
LTSEQADRALDSRRRIELRIAPGTPVRIALTNRVRIAGEGTPVEGRVTDTVYAFDQPLIPAGSKAHGHVTRVAPVPKVRRTMVIANANFSPLRECSLTFDSIELAGARSLPIETTVAPGIAETVHLVSDPVQSAKKSEFGVRLESFLCGIRILWGFDVDLQPFPCPAAKMSSSQRHAGRDRLRFASRRGQDTKQVMFLTRR